MVWENRAFCLQKKIGCYVEKIKGFEEQYEGQHLEKVTTEEM